MSAARLYSLSKIALPDTGQWWTGVRASGQSQARRINEDAPGAVPATPPGSFGSATVVFMMVLVAFAAALGAPWLRRAAGALTAPLLALVPLGMFFVLASNLPREDAAAWTESLPWVPTLGIDLAFRLDGLAATFALLITGIGTLILLYTHGYMGRDPQVGRLCGLLLLFLGAMLGVVFADDVFVLFVFWELTGIASYLLIGFKHDKQAARDAARQALLVTGAGGLVLLAGLILLVMAGRAAGLPLPDATKISSLATGSLHGQPLTTPALVLIVIGACAKSAQMPLHFWLPSAMAAPTPVSAYLHSATMVKAGVYLLARLNPILGDELAWHVLLTTIGALTMLGAAALAAGQTDLKRILAYSTVSVLGTLTMLIGIGTDLALKAAVVYLVAHACYKAALFMIAGSIEHATGSRDVRELGGLFRVMPFSAVAGGLAALSMAGAPPLFGFIGKELLLKAKLDLENLGVVLILVATVANILLIAMALVVAVWPFYGRRGAAAREAHAVPAAMWFGPLLLATVGLFIGIIPGTFDATLGTAMASSVAGAPLEMKLTLWHGVSPLALTALGISAVTLALGVLLFARLHDFIERIMLVVLRLGRIGPARGYELALAGLFSMAAWVTRTTQTGSLRRYVRIVLLVFVATATYPLVRCLPFSDVIGLGWHWHEVFIATMTIAAVVVAMRSTSRLSAIALLGVTGLLIAVLFMLFSAPDLAVTQIMVETLTVILLVLVFHRLPRFARWPERFTRYVDAGLALAAGAVMTMYVLASAAVDLPATVSAGLAARAKLEAYGRNVVNVILVDFRALDTLGEITVVAVAALGVYAMLRAGQRMHRRGVAP
jgi:multicomponent Na+:H+ antiporter subunit A